MSTKQNDSLFSEMIKNCKNRFHKYNNSCPQGKEFACGKCLESIHYPRRLNGDPNRTYDCIPMADYYVCKYAPKYTSEIVHTLKKVESIINKQTINVLSFGCGPCTDLLALEYMKKTNMLHYDKLEYMGIDCNKEIWQTMHNEIKKYRSNCLSVNFCYEDIINMVDNLSQRSWNPNLIFFQYVLSDMHKHSTPLLTTTFINNFSKYFNEKLEPNSLVILNDINLNNSNDGGRDYFDLLVKNIKSFKQYKYHFYNENSSYPGGGYGYGALEFNNSIMFDMADYYNTEEEKMFTPFNKCSSAVLIIKKE